MLSICKDVDEFLKNSGNPETDFTSLLKNAVLVKKQDASENLNPEQYTFENFQVLGELQDERIAFWSEVNRKIYITTLKDLNIDKLVQIGGREVFQRVTRKFQEGKIPFNRLKKHLIIEASMRQLSDSQWFGQGIHLLKSGNLLIVNGGYAWTWAGNDFVCHEFPLVEDNLLELQPAREWIDFDRLKEKVKIMDAEKGEEIIHSLLNLFAQWGFQGGLDHVLLCGWFLAQIIQSTWDWRPHLWCSGAQGSGKSLLIQLMKKLGGKLAISLEGNTLTEAGLRQSINNDSILVAIDEFEKSKYRDDIIELLRSAGRGGFSAKGTQAQKAHKFKIRHMVFVGSIETGLSRAAENSRFLELETKKDSENRNPQIPDARTIQTLNLDSVAFSIWAAEKAKNLIHQIDFIKGFDRRFLQSLAVPFSMIAVCKADPIDALNTFLRDYAAEWMVLQDGAMQEDEQKLLEDAFMSNIKTPKRTTNMETGFDSTQYVVRTVSQLIGEAGQSEEIDATLQAHGIKVRPDGVFFHPDKVRRELLQDTVWRDLNIRKILLRLPNAKAFTDRLAGVQRRGVLIPLSVIEEGDAKG